LHSPTLFYPCKNFIDVQNFALWNQGHSLRRRNMATCRHGILPEVRGLHATEGYGALNLQALMRAPRMMTRTSATWSATKQSASLCEAALLGGHNAEVLGEFGDNDEEIEMLRKEGILNEKED
jgi:crotonobetainyl-CoA:carnitine CoA-transferase CaiB-like acyl-CoA transferase